MLNTLNNCPKSIIANLEENGLLTLTINRPERKNALLPDMYLWLASVLDDSNTSDEVKVILLNGEGGDFTAGNDMSAFSAEAMQGTDSPAFVFLRSCANTLKPLICAVKGVAIGIGTTVLLHADLVYTEANTRFQLPFTSLGLVPEGAASLLLPERAGYLQASSLLLLAEMFDAQTALQANLVNAIVDNANEAALKAAHRLLALPTKSIQLTKGLLKDVTRTKQIVDVIDTEAELFIKRAQEEDLTEAVAAFMQKRKPVFK